MAMDRVTIIPPGPGNPYDTPIIDPVGITRKYLDVSYTPGNPHPMRQLDVYLPEEGEGPFPVLIYMHGGGFVHGRKNDFHVENYLKSLDEGFAFVSVEQRLCSPLPGGGYGQEGVFPYSLFDLKAAIRYLRANAIKYALDTERFALLGTSAGGYHVAMAAATRNVPAMYDDALGFPGVSERVHAVVNLFGVGDLALQAAHSDKMAQEQADAPGLAAVNFANVFFGAEVLGHPHLSRFANPETWVTPDMPPMLLRMGAADRVVPVECSRRLAKRIEEVCGKDRVDYDEFPDYAHGDPRFHDPENHRRMWDWLKAKL